MKGLPFRVYTNQGHFDVSIDFRARCRESIRITYGTLKLPVEDPTLVVPILNLAVYDLLTQWEGTK